MEMKEFFILLYYCYSKIEDPEKFREEHHMFCIENNLKGRIIISGEGINGTISGRKESCKKYMDLLHNDPRFAHTDFKVEEYHQSAFDKLHVRVKDEIVHSGLKDTDPNEQTGTYLEPKEFKDLKDQEDVVILDVRSNYEHKIGK